MINWDEFEHIHVIQKLKSIISQWWNIETVFTDDTIYIRMSANSAASVRRHDISRTVPQIKSHQKS